MDKNQANVAKSIENNITATTPSGDPVPKRDPNDGRKKTKIGFRTIGIAAGIRAGLELSNPDPSKDAVEAHTQTMQYQSVEKKQSVWDIIVNLFK